VKCINTLTVWVDLTTFEKSGRKTKGATKQASELCQLAAINIKTPLNVLLHKAIHY